MANSIVSKKFIAYDACGTDENNLEKMKAIYNARDNDNVFYRGLYIAATLTDDAEIEAALVVAINALY